MKKARSRVKDELPRSYKRSDFPAGFIRGKYAARLAAGSNVVVLSPENAAVFPTSDAVNEALNGLVRVAKSARLLRNWRIEEFAGFAIEEGEAEAGGALAKSAEDAEAMVGIIGGSSRILTRMTSSPRASRIS
jgi:hypothetical protein